MRKMRRIKVMYCHTWKRSAVPHQHLPHSPCLIFEEQSQRNRAWPSIWMKRAQTGSEDSWAFPSQPCSMAEWEFGNAARAGTGLEPLLSVTQPVQVSAEPDKVIRLISHEFSCTFNTGMLLPLFPLQWEPRCRPSWSVGCWSLSSCQHWGNQWTPHWSASCQSVTGEK